MNIRGLLVITLIVIGVGITCMGLGWLAGRYGAQRAAAVEASNVHGTPVGLREGRRFRVYLGPEIQGEPAFTIVAGLVYRGAELEKAILTLDNQRVYSGAGTDGPQLYWFDDNRVVEGVGDGPTRFVQRDNQIYFGSDPDAPTLFTFEGTHVYRGTASDGRILATANTALNDPDLTKLVTIILYMELLE